MVLSNLAIKYTSFVLSVISCVVGLLGNAAVICIIGFILKKNKYKIWFLNLAVADFVSLLCLPLSATSVLTESWPFGLHMCRIHNFLAICHKYGSIFTITALTVDRVLSVAKPIWHKKFFSKSFCYLTCAVIWAITILGSLPAIFFSIGDENFCGLFDIEEIGNETTIGTHVNHGEGRYNLTESKWINRSSLPVVGHEHYGSIPNSSETFALWKQSVFTVECITVTILVMSYFIPLCVILISNIIIVRNVQKSPKVKSPKLYRITLTVVLVYFLTWTPLVADEIIILVAARQMNFELMSKCYSIMPVVYSLAYTNSCINPIIYVLVGTQVKTGLKTFISTGRLRSSGSSQTTPTPQQSI